MPRNIEAELSEHVRDLREWAKTAKITAEEVKVVEAILRWIVPQISYIGIGLDGHDPGFACVLLTPDNSHYKHGFFRCDLRARTFEVYFATIRNWRPFLHDEVALLELRRRLNRIPGIEISIGDLKRYPAFAIQVLASQRNMAQFQEVMDWVIHALKHPDTPVRASAIEILEEEIKTVRR